MACAAQPGRTSCGSRRIVALAVSGTIMLGACAGSASVGTWAPPQGVVFRPPASVEPASHADIWTDITSSRLIIIGEEHDDLTHHQVQASVVRSLADTGAPVVIALEMLGWDAAGPTRRYSDGTTNITTFMIESEWTERWGLGMEMYGDIVELAQRPNVRLVGINSPDGLSSAVFERGHAELARAEKLAMPYALDTTDDAYRAFVTDALLAHMSDVDPALVQRFFEAQLTWDHSMAGALDSLLASAPDDTYVVVIVGYGHVQFDWGIPSRVRALPRDEILTIVCASEHAESSDPSVSDVLCYETPTE